MKKALKVASILGLLAALLGGLWLGREHLLAPARDPAAVTETGAHLRAALELARLMQLTRARAELEDCLRAEPGHALASFHLGRVLGAQGRFDQSRALFDHAVRAAPGDTRILRFLQDVYANHPRLRDPVRSNEYRGRLRRLGGELMEFDLNLARPPGPGEPVDIYSRARKRLSGRRLALTPPMLRLYDALFVGGETSRSLGLPGYGRLRPLIDENPGLFALREAVAARLAEDTSRIGLPTLEGDEIAGSRLTLEISQQLYERLMDFSWIGSTDFAHFYRNLTTLEILMGDFRAALSRLRFLAKTVPQRREDTRFEIALCHYKLDEFDAARTVLRELLASSPDHRLGRWLAHLLDMQELTFRQEPLPVDLEDRFRFREAAAALAIDKRDGGGSSAWADIDADGDLDLFVSGCDTYSVLYRNEGGTFTDASRQVGLGEIPAGFSNVFVDFDSDGDPDLFVGRNGWVGPGQNSLYENRGDGTFVDVTARSGLADGPPGSSFTSSWADFDRDGNLDLFVANGICGDGSINRLYRGRGDGTFVDATATAGLAEPPGTRTIGSTVGDYDQDGWPDIFLCGFEEDRNRLYHNRGDGTFEEVALRAGVGDETSRGVGFVAFMEDFDGDTRPDLAMVKWEPSFELVLDGMLEGYRPRSLAEQGSPRLFINRGDGTFRDASAEYGLLYPHGAMGGGVADLDNDGYLELFVGNGGPSFDRLEPDALYANVAGRRFVDIARHVGVGSVGKGHGLSFADLDRDGDLDVYVPLGGAYHGDMWSNVFFFNEAGNRRHWLQVLLAGTRSHRMAVGAQVIASAGSLRVLREVKCGVGFGASDSPYLHFGLGENERVDTLTVRWPAGADQVFRDVPADRFVVIVEGEGGLHFEDTHR